MSRASSLGAPPPDYHLALWHGVNVPLMMSGVALAAGVALYFALQRGYDLHLHHPRGWTGRLIFTRALDGLFNAARRVSQRLESGSLQRYAAALVASAVALAAWPLLSGPALTTGTRTLLPATPLALVLWALLAATCAALVATHHRRFQAVVLVGVVGMICRRIWKRWRIGLMSI